VGALEGGGCTGALNPGACSVAAHQARPRPAHGIIRFEENDVPRGAIL
jgi:hypothetical protein